MMSHETWRRICENLPNEMMVIIRIYPEVGCQFLMIILVTLTRFVSICVHCRMWISHGKSLETPSSSHFHGASDLPTFWAVPVHPFSEYCMHLCLCDLNNYMIMVVHMYNWLLHFRMWHMDAYMVMLDTHLAPGSVGSVGQKANGPSLSFPMWELKAVSFKSSWPEHTSPNVPGSWNGQTRWGTGTMKNIEKPHGKLKTEGNNKNQNQTHCLNQLLHEVSSWCCVSSLGSLRHDSFGLWNSTPAKTQQKWPQLEHEKLYVSISKQLSRCTPAWHYFETCDFIWVGSVHSTPSSSLCPSVAQIVWSGRSGLWSYSRRKHSVISLSPSKLQFLGRVIHLDSIKIDFAFQTIILVYCNKKPHVVLGNYDFRHPLYCGNSFKHPKLQFDPLALGNRAADLKSCNAALRSAAPQLMVDLSIFKTKDWIHTKAVHMLGWEQKSKIHKEYSYNSDYKK